MTRQAPDTAIVPIVVLRYQSPNSIIYFIAASFSMSVNVSHDKQDHIIKSNRNVPGDSCSDNSSNESFVVTVVSSE